MTKQTSKQKMGGRGTGKFERGERVTDIREIKVGDLLVNVSRQFNAVNLIKVVSLDDTGLRRDIFYWRYADGDREGRLFGNVGPDDLASRFAMWGFEFAEGRLRELYRAVKRGGSVHAGN